MLMAIASTDHLTGHEPHYSCKFLDWMKVFIGTSDPKLPSWCKGALINCAQFARFNLDDLGWHHVELARLYGVGMLPQSRRNKGFDLLIPFERRDGKAAALMISIKNSVKGPSGDAKSKLKEQAERLSKSRTNFYESRGLACPKSGKGVLTLLLCLAHGRGSRSQETFPCQASRSSKRRWLAEEFSANTSTRRALFDRKAAAGRKTVQRHCIH